MKNKEKYSEGILKLFKSQGSVTKDGDVGFCDYTSCGDCIFSNHNCGEKMRTEWLEQEYKESIVLTEDEKAILRNIDKRYKYIARSYDTLEVFETKPYKVDAGNWSWSKGYGDVLRVFNHLFTFVKNEDEEPYLIEDLLNECEH